jgi:hypothetical protein
VDTLELFVRVAGFIAALSATVPSLLYARKRAHDVAQGQLIEVQQDTIDALEARTQLLELTVEARDTRIAQLADALAACRQRVPQ